MLTRFRSSIGHTPLALCKGLLAFGAAELSVRLVRLATVVLIARQLSPDIVGVAALSLTLFELVRVLANIGVGQKIIAAAPDQLGATCNTAHGLMWCWCGGVALVQLLVALILWLGFDQRLAAQMLAVLSLVYLFMPGGLVSCYLLMREGRATVTARTQAAQTMADHLLSAALLLVWQSPWSIVLPKLLTAPIWLVLTRRARPWRPEPGMGRVPLLGMMRFGLPILATEIMGALRVQLDKLIIVASFGVTTLGTWFFAFNAGIGIASSLIAAFGTLAFPALCGGERSECYGRLRQIAAVGAVIFIPVVLAQSLLAPLYVPIIFGANWAHAIPLIATLCLAAIPMLCATVTTAWLRAQGRTGHDALAAVAMTVASLLGLWIGCQTGDPLNAAIGWASGTAIVAIPFAVRTLWRDLSSSSLAMKEVHA